MSNYSIKVLTPLNSIQYNFILVIINDFKEKELKVLKKKKMFLKFSVALIMMH